MKFTPEVVAALEVLRAAAENDFERHRIDVLEHDLHEPPVVEAVDDKHQRFNGVNFRKTQDGHFVSSNQPIHRAVWLYYVGEIPEGFVIHHVDEVPDNNKIENLQALSFDEHNKLHNPKGRGNRTQRKVFTCEHCGREYEAFDVGVNRYCSPQCRQQHSEKQAKNITKTCPFCGKEFKTRHHEAKFCSKACARRAYCQQRRREKN